jgi:hypothetical protein
MEKEVRQGLVMVKFAINHDHEFLDSGLAIFTGFLQAFISFVVEIVALIFLATQMDPLSVIKAFVPLTIVAQVDNFYVASLPKESRLHVTAVKPLVITEFRN